MNIGSGRSTSVRAVAETLAERLGVSLAPVTRNEFRPGEMRSLISDISLARRVGYSPSVELSEGIGRYLDWVSSQGDLGEYFSAAEEVLRRRGIVQGGAAPSDLVCPGA